MAEQNDINNIMACVCPHCQQTVRIRRPQTPGRYKFTCTSCSKPFALSFKDETQMEETEEKTEAPTDAGGHTPENVVRVHRDNDRYTTIGGLIEKHRGFFGKDKTHPLHLGAQYIGRSDNKTPSDISLMDDTVSRQSLVLTVDQHRDDSGITYSYSLKVHRSKNPVLHNGVALLKDEEILLHINDVITVGKTRLILK